MLTLVVAGRHLSTFSMCYILSMLNVLKWNTVYFYNGVLVYFFSISY